MLIFITLFLILYKLYCLRLVSIIKMLYERKDFGFCVWVFDG